MLLSQTKLSRLAKHGRWVFSFALILSLLIGPFGPFSIAPKTARAALDDFTPGLMHWGISQIKGALAATTTVYVFAMSGDDLATPGGSPDLTVTAFYKNPGWGGWGESACLSQETDSHLFKCALGVSGGSDARTFEYYLRARDEQNAVFRSFATNNNSTSSAQAAPFEAVVYNSPIWTNGVSVAYDSTDPASFEVAGVKDGRCAGLSRLAPTATTTVYTALTSAQTNQLANTPNEWIALNSKKYQIRATSTVGSEMEIVLSGPLDSDAALGSCINKFLAGATVWIEGTTISATTSNANATSSYGAAKLYNAPNGSFEVAAFKNGYMDSRQMGVSLFGTATTTIDFFLPYGDMGGGGDMEGAFVIWSAPMNNMMGAPTSISLNTCPIIVGLSENASSTTITTSNVLLKKMNSDGTTSLVSGYSVAYEPMGQSVTISSQSYDFGPDAQIIVYSSTSLTTSTNYILKITSDVKDSNGNSISGNDPAGGHSIFFSTPGGDFSDGFALGDFAQGAQYMPPFVMSALPMPGEMNASQNTKIVLMFDQAMSSDSTQLTNYVELWKLDSSFNLSAEQSVSSSLSQTDSTVITITPASNLSAGRYRLLVKGGMTSSTGVPIGPPGSENNVMFQSEFQVGSSADLSAPTITGTSLNRYENTSGSYVDVPVSSPLKIAFSEAMNPDTLSSSSLYVNVKGSTTKLTATTEYDMTEGKALLMPASALNASTTYTLTLNSRLKDLTKANNPLATTTYEFTTGSVDTEKPSLQFFNADDYHLSLTFSEPMNAASITNTNQWSSGKTKWQTSVLNPANYILYVDNGPPGTGSSALYFNCANLAGTSTNCISKGAENLTFSYDVMYKTVEIEGLLLQDPLVGLSGANGVRVWVNNITDVSGNTIKDSNSLTPPDQFGSNAMGGPFFNSMDTFGMIGPGGGMMGPPPTAGEFTVTDFGGKDPAMMGMMPVGVWPMNTVAGAVSIYMIDIPISSGKAITAGGKIILGPFPDEANVSGAKNADLSGQFAHYDLNGPGTGKVVLGTAAETSGGLANDGVTVSGQVVTITLGAVATQAPDFLHLELDGIQNPISTTQGGYKIGIQTKDGDDRQLESFTSMPFFIMPKGKFYIVGHATTTASPWGLNDIQIYGGSPMTGPLFVSTANNAFGSSTDGEFKIEGLNAGQVMLSPEPYIVVSGVEYTAPMPEPIFLDNSTTADTPGAAIAGITGCTSNTACYYYKEFTLDRISTANKPNLTVQIYGNFSAGGVASTDIDIFAGGPNGFAVKTLSLSADYSSTPTSTTFYLPSTGDFHVGIGPAMPKGPMGMASPPMPTSWMPPKDEYVSVSGASGSWSWIENDGINNDGTVSFSIEISDQTISGHVYDSAGVAVSNAEVFAYSPTEFFGTNTHVNQDGSFTLNVKTGLYKVGAFLPGAPPTNEATVNVKSNGAVYLDGVITTDLILRMSKNLQSGYTISGTVYSDTASNYPASDASIYAYRTDGPGHAETMTDSKGTYTLYVGTGAWNIGSYLPDYGNLTEQTITVAPSRSGLNFAPDSATTYVTIRERVWEDKNNNSSYDAGEGIPRATVSVISTSTSYINTAVTDTNGIYEVKVTPSTVYDIETWAPEIGSLPPQKNLQVTTSDIIYSSFSGFADVPTEHATTVEFTFYDSSGNATSVSKVLIQLDQMSAEGVSNDVYKENVATSTIKAATSTNDYLLDLEIQGVPKELLTITPLDTATTSVATSTVGGKRFAAVTVNGYEKIKIILPPLCYISGQAQDEEGTALPNAIIHVEQPGKDIEFDVEADSSGNYSFAVASSTTPYLVQAVKGGYIDSGVSVYASTSAAAFNPSMEETTYTISGAVTVGNSAPGENFYVWAEKLGGGYSSNSSGNPTTGSYSLRVTDGDWEVSAVIEGYSERTGTVIAHVAGANVTGLNLNQSASQTSALNKQKTLGMAGTVGGTLTNKDANFTMNVPQSTISASDSSSYNVKEKEISNIPGFTPNANLVGGKAEEVSAYKMSGSSGGVSTVSNLNGAVFIDKIFTVDELAAENIDTVGEIEETKMGAYSNNNWTTLPTTISYLDSDNQPVIPQENLSNVANVVFNGVTKHFSTFGVVNTTFDSLAPSAPTNVQTAVSGTTVTVSWTAVSASIDGTTANDISGYNIWRANSNSDDASWTKIASVASTTLSYADARGTTGNFYYKVTADSGLQSSFSSAASASIASAATGSYGVSLSYGSTAQSPAPETTEEPAEETSGSAGGGDETAPVEEPSQIALAEPTAPAEEPSPAPAPTMVQISGISSGFTFTAKLKIGMRSQAIKNLQVVLNADPDTRLAETGLGSPGNETTYFGQLTKQAVIRFQEKYSQTTLSPWGLTKGTGLVGRTTREKLNELITSGISLGEPTSQAPAEPEPEPEPSGPSALSGMPTDFSFTAKLKLNMRGPQIKYLQMLLNADSDTQLTQIGLGSPGQETEYFGRLTKAAVIKFQEKYSATVLAPWNLSTGTGLVGKTTRQKLNELLGR